MIHVDTESFFVIVVIAALAAVTVAVVPRRFAPPVVVVELLLGILVGPQVFDVAKTDNFINFFSNLGLGMLFFFAGYEIDFERIKGRPLKLGAWGWLLSVALAYGIGGDPRGRRHHRLLPLHRLGDGDDRDRHADPDSARQRRAEDQVRHLPAGGRRRRRVRPDPAGHALPLHRSPPARGGDPDRLHPLAIAVALVSVRLAWRGWPALERTFEASSQLAVRVTVVLVFGLVLLAGKLGLDVLLGGFVAGMITRLALKGHELQVFESKLTAVGFGFFVPFFFVTSGIDFDLDALGSLDAIAQAGDVLRPLPRGARRPRAAALPRRARRPRPRRARLLLGDRAAPRRRDHHDRDRRPAT